MEDYPPPLLRARSGGGGGSAQLSDTALRGSSSPVLGVFRGGMPRSIWVRSGLEDDELLRDPQLPCPYLVKQAYFIDALQVL